MGRISADFNFSNDSLRTPMNRDQIIKEIQRTAATNGGIPLGSRRFTTTTGIRESDWLGKYWARWGDALTEAGLTPNQLQSAYGMTYLLELCVSLTRELGRLPTANDLRLKDRTDPQFPSQKVFERLGTKAELVQLLFEHCRGRRGHEDVTRLCEAYVPRKQRIETAVGPSADTGFVYLLKSGRFYKIGFSNSVGRRAYELGIQLPERAAIVHEILTDDPSGIESYWHNRFSAKRKNGEWFELDAADLTAFKRRKFM